MDANISFGISSNQSDPSTLMNDTPTHQSILAEGFNPVPPRSDDEDDDDQIDPSDLDTRFRILRQLLPHGSQLQDKDDLLKLAHDYVRELEREIQSFNFEVITNNTSKQENLGALQRKGLCIVQLSKLTTAF